MASQKEARPSGCKHRISADKTCQISPAHPIAALFTGHRFRHTSRVFDGTPHLAAWGIVLKKVIGWGIVLTRLLVGRGQRKKDAKYSVLPHKVAVQTRHFQGSGISPELPNPTAPSPGNDGIGNDGIGNVLVVSAARSDARCRCGGDGQDSRVALNRRQISK